MTAMRFVDTNVALYAVSLHFEDISKRRALRPRAMVINDDNATKIEALFRERLERNFQGTGLKFNPIIVELAYDQFDQKTFDVMVVFDGDYGLLKPGTLNAISNEMVDEYAAMGIFTTVTDGYVSKEEWDMRDELFLDIWEELNEP